MKVVSWNCRGLGGSIKVEALKNLLKTEKPNFLLIQETKMSEEEVMNRLSLSCKNGVGKAISSKGASGGIATSCRSNKFNIRSTKENSHWLLLEMQTKATKTLSSFVMFMGLPITETSWNSGIPCSL